MATTYDKASLVMIPSGYKDDKLYSVKPTDGSGDFTFSRDGAGASPATRVNASGLIEKGRTNFQTYSEDFTNAVWQKDSVSITGGQTDPNGGTTAALATATASSNVYFYSSSTLVGVYSIYAKAGNRSNFCILNGVLNNGADFDLAAETATAVGQGSLAKIENVGGDWYRCSVLISSASLMIIGLSDSAGGGMNSGDTMYFAFAQRETGIVATDYIPTTSAPVSAGLLGDMPRLDYSGGATCPSLLLEPSRVNVVTYSEYFGLYTQYGSPTITHNDTLSPEGVMNGTKVQRGTNEVPIRIGGITTLGTEYTMSLWAKAGTATKIRIEIGDESAPTYDLTSEWQRIDVTATPNTYNHLDIEMPLSSSGDYFYIYGLQLEQASYPTSYIPTYGSASGRAEDVCIKTQTFNDLKHNDVTLFYDFDHLGDLSAGQNQFVAYFGSGKYLNLAQYDANVYYVDTDINGSYFFATAFAATEGRKKVAIKIDGLSWKVFFNGSKIIDTTLTQQSANAMTEIILSGGTISRPSFQSVHQVLALTALTDAECIALTTI